MSKSEIHTGVVLPNAVVGDVLEQLNQALNLARCIGIAGRQPLALESESFEEPVDLAAATMAVAGLIKVAYDSLDQGQSNGQYIHDLRRLPDPIQV